MADFNIEAMPKSDIRIALRCVMKDNIIESTSDNILVICKREYLYVIICMNISIFMDLVIYFDLS